MKKSVPKPIYWPDFEDLCKKLWGAEWQIPSKIKKNGRSGDDQSGVDVVGKPLGHSNYWAIQCKGKDDYTDAKLTKNEIEDEIEKAKKFKPKLEVFIFATTANKNAKIEEYIREKDIELQKEFFEIILFSWEDIVDLLEDHPTVLQWYLDKTKSVIKYDFQVLFNDFSESISVHPKMTRQITKYIYKDETIKESLEETNQFLSDIKIKLLSDKYKISPMFRSEYVNKSWVDFEIILDNNGQSVIEDWHFKLWFISGVMRIDDEPIAMVDVSSVNINQNDPRWIDTENKSITYRPNEKSVLVQKDNKHFRVSILPNVNAKRIELKWELKSRDFAKEETKFIDVIPELKEEIVEVEVFEKNEEKEETEIKHLRVKR